MQHKDQNRIIENEIMNGRYYYIERNKKFITICHYLIMSEGLVNFFKEVVRINLQCVSK